MRYLQKTKETEKLKLDVKDKKILSILSANSRIPLTQLSKKVGLSRDAVNYRIKNYEKKGIIQEYRTMVDMSKFGYKANHIFIKLNNPSKEIEQKILNKLIKYPFVRAVIKFSGNFDFEIAGKVKLSADAVAYRIKNMINSGIIIKFIPVINYTSLDYNLYTLLLNISGLDEKKEKIL